MIFASFLPSKAGFDIFGLKLWGATALFFELVAVIAINAWSRAASWDRACERRCAGVGKEMNYCCELLLWVCVRWSSVSAEAAGVKWGGEVAEIRNGSSDLQYIFYNSGSTTLVDIGHLKANQLNATGLSLDGSHDLDCRNR